MALEDSYMIVYVMRCDNAFVWLVMLQQLSEVLEECGQKWELNPGDGAFYGPKVVPKLSIFLPKLLPLGVCLYIDIHMFLG